MSFWLELLHDPSYRFCKILLLAWGVWRSPFVLPKDAIETPAVFKYHKTPDAAAASGVSFLPTTVSAVAALPFRAGISKLSDLPPTNPLHRPKD